MTGDLFPEAVVDPSVDSDKRYGHPGNREGVGVGSPAFGSVLLVWR